jgi:hypothetical protein
MTNASWMSSVASHQSQLPTYWLSTDAKYLACSHQSSECSIFDSPLEELKKHSTSLLSNFILLTAPIADASKL